MKHRRTATTHPQLIVHGRPHSLTNPDGVAALTLRDAVQTVQAE